MITLAGTAFYLGFFATLVIPYCFSVEHSSRRIALVWATYIPFILLIPFLMGSSPFLAELMSVLLWFSAGLVSFWVLFLVFMFFTRNRFLCVWK
jgi:hypothetical protein